MYVVGAVQGSEEVFSLFKIQKLESPINYMLREMMKMIIIRFLRS